MIPHDNSGARLPLFDPRSSTLGPSAIVGGSSSDTTARQSWLRAMEQAQIARWFQPFEAPTTADTPTTSSVCSGSASVLVRPYCPQAPAPVVHIISQVTSTEEKLRDDTNTGPANFSSESGPESTQTQTVGRPAIRTISPEEQGSATLSDAGVTLRGAVWAKGDGIDQPVTENMPCVSPYSPKSLSTDGKGQPTLRTSYAGVGGTGQTTVAGQVHLADAPAITPMVTENPPVAERLPFGAIAVVDQLVFAESVELTTTAKPDLLAGSVNASGPPRTVSAHEPASARWHVQWGPEGLELWLGLDGTSQQVGQQAALIVQQLCSALQLQGQRLNRLVCNGQLVWDATDSHQQVSSRRFANLLGAPISAPFLAPYPSSTFPTFFRESP